MGCPVLNTADCGIPVSALLTSASMHGSLAEMPLSLMTAQHVTNCYDLMDAAHGRSCFFRGIFLPQTESRKIQISFFDISFITPLSIFRKLLYNPKHEEIEMSEPIGSLHSRCPPLHIYEVGYGRGAIKDSGVGIR